MANCANCRSVVADGARFCNECGTPVSAAEGLSPRPPSSAMAPNSPGAPKPMGPHTERVSHVAPTSDDLRAGSRTFERRGRGGTQMRTTDPLAPDSSKPSTRVRKSTAPTGHSPDATIEEVVAGLASAELENAATLPRAPNAPDRFSTPPKTVAERMSILEGPVRAHRTLAGGSEHAPAGRTASTTLVDEHDNLPTPARSLLKSPRPLGGFLVSFQYEPLGTFWAIGVGTNIVGRAGARLNLDVGIADTTVSGEHAVVSVDEGAIFVEDRGTTNGTRVNGQRIEPHGKVALVHGDRLRFGSFETIVVVVPYAAAVR